MCGMIGEGRVGTLLIDVEVETLGRRVRPGLGYRFPVSRFTHDLGPPSSDRQRVGRHPDLRKSESLPSPQGPVVYHRLVFDPDISF